MKKLLFVLCVLLFSANSFAQKVKFKKDVILVDDAEWGYSETEIPGNKYTLSTLDKEEYIIFTFERVNTGKYHSNGKEIQDVYLTIKFLNSSVEAFEINVSSRKELVRLLIKNEVIKDGKFNEENALKFKEKYAEDMRAKYPDRVIIIKD